MFNLDFVDGFHDVEENRLKKALPPEYPIDLTHKIEEDLRSVSDEMVVFLEDDSTGAAAIRKTKSAMSFGRLCCGEPSPDRFPAIIPAHCWGCLWPLTK